MPWCPKCNSEYREGFETCPDCLERQVDEQPVVIPSPISTRQHSEFERSTVTAIAVVVPLFLAFLVLVGLLYGWMAMNYDVYIRFSESIIYCTLLAAALAGFITGAILNQKVRSIHVFVAGITSGLILLLSVLIASGFYRSWADLQEMLGVLLILPQMVATLACARGIKYAKESRWKNALWLLGFIIILNAAIMSMYPLFKLLYK